jgi:hypothetical protein
LRLPFVVWIDSCREEHLDGWIEDATAFICSECCIEKYRGLSSDMRRITTAKEIERLGFHCTAGAVSGGFLMSGTNNKQ